MSFDKEQTDVIFDSVSDLLDAMKHNELTVIFCETPEERNTATQILHDEYDVPFGNSGYAAEYYRGRKSTDYMHVMLGSAGGIEYRNNHGHEFISFADFMALVDAEHTPIPSANDADFAALFGQEVAT